jgi:polar amino acid transport system substrate-binding protein
MDLRSIRLLGACALVTLLSAACAPAHPPLERAAAVAALRVGVTPDTAPYVYLEQGQYNQYAGIEIDLASRLAAALGRRLTIVPVAWDEQIPSLLTGRTDVIMSGMSITPDRSARVAFGEPYLTTSLQAVVRRDDTERWPTPQALIRTSPNIGVKGGTTGEAFVRERRPDGKVVVYRRSKDAITELLNYRIDVYVSDAPVIEAAVLGNPKKLAAYPRVVGEQSIAWGFRPEDAELRTAANQVLARWRSDGTLRHVLASWPSVAE